jgi:hypothetical protein
MKLAFALAALVFAGAATVQIFLPRRLPNAVVYCLCAWVLARVRASL